MKKVYPRARVSKHATLDGWVIDLIQRDGAKPKRVTATYSSIPWAHRAARLKLGLKVEPTVQAPRPAAARGTSNEAQQAPSASSTGAGTCRPCNRPMRRAGSKAEDHPGTVLRQREGLCQSCRRKEA